jgi:hypothetical protein
VGKALEWYARKGLSCALSHSSIASVTIKLACLTLRRPPNLLVLVGSIKPHTLASELLPWLEPDLLLHIFNRQPLPLVFPDLIWGLRGRHSVS